MSADIICIPRVRNCCRSIRLSRRSTEFRASGRLGLLQAVAAVKPRLSCRRRIRIFFPSRNVRNRIFQSVDFLQLALRFSRAVHCDRRRICAANNTCMPAVMSVRAVAHAEAIVENLIDQTEFNFLAQAAIRKRSRESALTSVTT